ncbi:MAG: hypothetical protein U0572_00740 [Phycisphaerales bacterium]
MTSPDPMSRDELNDLAPLDAFGFLDDYEAALFNRSFHHAPASVQDEVRALQAGLVTDPAFLSTEEPRALLKQKVLLRVQEEIEALEEELQPLAQIGQSVAAQAAGGFGAGQAGALAARGGNADGESGEAEFGAPPASDRAMRELVAEIRARASLGVKDRATPYWRAATFFLAAGLIVSLYFLGRFMRTAETVARLAQQQVISAELAAAVPDLTDFAYRDSQIRGLLSIDSKVNGTATLYIDPQHHRALLLALGLSASKGPFTLRAVDEVGNATVIANFKTTDPVFGMVAENLPADMLTCKLELLDGDGKVILRTA